MAQDTQEAQDTHRRLVVIIPKELIHRAKEVALQRDVSLRALVEEAIEKEVSGAQPPKGYRIASTPTPERVKPTATQEEKWQAEAASLEAFAQEQERMNAKLKKELERRDAEEAAKKAQAGR